MLSRLTHGPIFSLLAFGQFITVHVFIWIEFFVSLSDFFFGLNQASFQASQLPFETRYFFLWIFLSKATDILVFFIFVYPWCMEKMKEVYNRILKLKEEIQSIAFFFFSFTECAKSLQSFLTLCNPIDCSPPGSSDHETLQARILEWIAIPSSRGSSQPRDGNHLSYVSCISRWILDH